MLQCPDSPESGPTASAHHSEKRNEDAQILDRCRRRHHPLRGRHFGLTSQAAHAADNDPIQTIFFGRELLAFQCGLHGGTFYDTGSGYGCHMAGGGEIYCESGTCTWWPAIRKVRPIGPIGVVTGVGVNRQLASPTPFGPSTVTTVSPVAPAPTLRAKP